MSNELLNEHFSVHEKADDEVWCMVSGYDENEESLTNLGWHYTHRTYFNYPSEYKLSNEKFNQTEFNLSGKSGGVLLCQNTKLSKKNFAAIIVDRLGTRVDAFENCSADGFEGIEIKRWTRLTTHTPFRVAVSNDREKLIQFLIDICRTLYPTMNKN